MKTRIILLAILNILIWNGVATAQTKYYQTPGIINGDGFTYQCDIKFSGVTLYNVKNKLMGTEWTNKDGTKPDRGVLLGTVRTLENHNEGKMVVAMISNILTDAEKTLLKNTNEDFGIDLYLDPMTGKVLEVAFRTATFSPSATIPPERFFKMEQEFKKNVIYVPTEAGRKLNCIVAGVRYTAY